MTELLASAVVITEEPPKFASLPTLPTAVLGGVGVTEYGPFEATLTTGFEEASELFGGLVAAADLMVAAMGFYVNGGSYFWFKRTVHYSPNQSSETYRQSATGEVTLTTTGAATQGSQTSTNAGPFNFNPADVCDLKVDGGGSEQAVFDAAAAAVTGTSGTYPTLWSGTETLIFTLDSGEEQTITFPASSHTLQEVIDYINPRIVGGYADDNSSELRITSDKEGLASRVEIGAGTANTELGFAGTEDVSGTGDVQDINAVTSTELKTVIEDDTTAEVVVEADQKVTIRTPTVGAGGSIQVEASSDIEVIVGWDTAVHSGSAAGPGDMGKILGKYEGTYANALSPVVSAASSGDANYFNMQFKEGTLVRETFPNLSTVLTDPRYWVTIINTSPEASKLLVAEDLLTGTPPDNQPDVGTYTITGGDNGLTSLEDNDFIGSAAGNTGLYGLNNVENLSLLVVPGRATAAVHQAMITYCEVTRKGRVFAILDPPAGLTAVGMIAYVKTTAAIKNLSEHAAIYWPRIKINNPNTSEFTSDANGMITVPPSAWVAGVYARTDASRPGGIYQPPAGVERGIIFGHLGFETDEVLDQAKRGLVYADLINPISKEGGLRFIDGTKTLKENGNWPQVQQRRGVIYIEATVQIGLMFARHSNNNRTLRRRCHRTVDGFLSIQMALEAFQTKKKATAYYVSFSDELNPQTVIRAKQLRGRMGLNMNYSADWVILAVSPDDRALEAELAA